MAPAAGAAGFAGGGALHVGVAGGVAGGGEAEAAGDDAADGLAGLGVFGEGLILHAVL